MAETAGSNGLPLYIHQPKPIPSGLNTASRWISSHKGDTDLLNQGLHQTRWHILPELQEIKSPSSAYRSYDPFYIDEKMTDAPLFSMSVNDALAASIDDITYKLHSLALSGVDCKCDVQNLENGLSDIKVMVDGLLGNSPLLSKEAHSSQRNSLFADTAGLHELSAVHTPDVGIERHIRAGMPTPPRSPVPRRLQNDVPMGDGPLSPHSFHNAWSIKDRLVIDNLFVPSRVTDTVSQPLAKVAINFPNGRSVKTVLEGSFCFPNLRLPY